MRKKLLQFSLVGMMIFGIAASTPVSAESGKFYMSYIFTGNSDSYIQNVNETKGALQVISPDYFELTADGLLQLSEKVDPAFVDAMHSRNIEVVPFLSNNWDADKGQKALQNREILSTQLADALNRYHLDGVNVDIENVNETYRDSLTDFVRLLRSKLPSDKEVSVAVAANPDGTSKGWVASFDYKELSRYSDYLMLMAYDESYPGDPTPGPVASLPYVEKSIQAVLNQIPREKLVLGIPFYGRLWNGDPGFNGEGLATTTVMQLVQKYNGNSSYDQTMESVRATFRIRSGDPVTKVNGKTLPAGNYTVWYENEQSMKAKLALVQKYGLKGAGSWSLNQETADTWNYFSLWLNGHYLADAEGHWAQNDIVAVANRGWMTGLTDTQFLPDGSLTRAQAAVVLVRALGLNVMVDAVNQTEKSVFTDVPKNYWAAKEIVIAQQKGYIDGVKDGYFAPEQPLTREQMCALLARILGLPVIAANSGFSDVSSKTWSFPAIESMVENNIAQGYGDGTFRPHQPISRAEMAALLNRIWIAKDL